MLQIKLVCVENLTLRMTSLGRSWVLRGIEGCNELSRNLKILSQQGPKPPFLLRMSLKQEHTAASSSPYILPKTPSTHKEKQTLMAVDDVRRGKVLQLRPTQDGGRPPDFCSFIESYPKDQVVLFFRDIIHEIEGRRKIQDFHLRVKNDPNSSFVIDIIYGDRKDGPEVLAPGSCISCHGDAPLYPDGGVVAGQCLLKEFGNQSYVQCSLDAKARPGFIVTPVRHVDRMSELEDEEIYFLWRVGVNALKSEGFTFTRMILNHGCYRNLAHLHLKIWVDHEMHRRARARWSEERRRLWAKLEYLANRFSKKCRVSKAVNVGILVTHVSR